MVVVSIVAILFALLAASVHRTRESARSMRCAANLRQLVAAMQHYESIFGVYPAGQGGTGHSVFVSLLPHLEQAPLYQAYNLTLGASSLAANRTVSGTSLALLQCPSEGGPIRQGMTNYAGNLGDGSSAFVSDDTGLFPLGSGPLHLAPRDVLDGTSQTSAFAEWLLGDESGGDPRRAAFVEEPPNVDETYEAFVARCQSRKGMKPNHTGLRGWTWIDGNWQTTLYDHGLPPNSPSCWRLATGSYRDYARSIRAIPAGSQHPGRIHVGFADGHVTSLKEGIELRVWMALGTRSGNEVVADRDW